MIQQILNAEESQRRRALVVWLEVKGNKKGREREAKEEWTTDVQEK